MNGGIGKSIGDMQSTMDQAPIQPSKMPKTLRFSWRTLSN